MAKELEVFNNYAAVLNELNGALNDEMTKISTEIIEPSKKSGLTEFYTMLWQTRNTIEEFQKVLRQGGKPSLLKVKYETAIIAFNRAVVEFERILDKTAKKEKIS